MATESGDALTHDQHPTRPHGSDLAVRVPHDRVVSQVALHCFTSSSLERPRVNEGAQDKEVSTLCRPIAKLPASVGEAGRRGAGSRSATSRDAGCDLPEGGCGGFRGHGVHAVADIDNP